MVGEAMSNSYRNIAPRNVDYDEEDAQDWRDPPPVASAARLSDDDTTQPQEDNTPKNLPDEVWLIPPNIPAKEIFGEKKANLKRIERNTNTHIHYNEDHNQIDMWGRRSDLDQALKQLNSIASNLMAERERMQQRRKSRGWAKPEKALTEKQRKKEERRKARETNEQAFLKPVPEKEDYIQCFGFFLIPDRSIPLQKVYGEKDDLLDPICKQQKCHILCDPINGLIKIVGENAENVVEATARVKQLYLKASALRRIPRLEKGRHPGKFVGWSYHVMEEPKSHYKVKLSYPPNGFVAPSDMKPSITFMLFEQVTDEGPTPSVVRKKQKSAVESAPPDLHKNNIAKVVGVLREALATVHLFDEEIKMRVRFGHVCFMSHPSQPEWSIKDLNEKVLSDDRLESKFATCLTDKHDRMRGLFEVLHDSGRKWENSPLTEFKIYCLREPTKDRTTKWRCDFDVQFKEDGKIGLWNVTANEKNILDMNMLCLERDYSWKLNLKTAKRLAIDKTGPQGTFIYKLRQSPNKHLVYTNTDLVRVKGVCEKTKEKFWWGEDDYVVEVTKYEFWNCKEWMDIKNIEIVLDKEPPTRVSYGVTLYRKHWDDNFAYNATLGTGESPEWHPSEMANDSKTDGLIYQAGEVIDILQKKLPRLRPVPPTYSK